MVRASHVTHRAVGVGTARRELLAGCRLHRSPLTDTPVSAWLCQRAEGNVMIY